MHKNNSGMKKLLPLMAVVFALSCQVNKKKQSVVENKQPETATEGGGVDFIKGKLDRGIEFYAIGNEPGWGLEMDMERDFKLSVMGQPDFNTPAVRGNKAADADVTNYHAVVEAGELDITLYNQGGCTDNMSGEKFTHKVRVGVRRGNEKDLTYFEGCGRFIFDQRLHDIWALESIRGRKVDIREGQGERPYLEFHTGDNRILGKTTCNSINGGAEVMGDKIQIKPLAVTMMGCPNHELEAEFLKELAPGTLSYRIDAGRLYLSRDGKEAMVLRKVD